MRKILLFIISAFFTFAANAADTARPAHQPFDNPEVKLWKDLRGYLTFRENQIKILLVEVGQLFQDLPLSSKCSDPKVFRIRTLQDGEGSRFFPDLAGLRRTDIPDAAHHAFDEIHIQRRNRDSTVPNFMVFWLLKSDGGLFVDYRLSSQELNQTLRRELTDARFKDICFHFVGDSPDYNGQINDIISATKTTDVVASAAAAAAPAPLQLPAVSQADKYLIEYFRSMRATPTDGAGQSPHNDGKSVQGEQEDSQHPRESVLRRALTSGRNILSKSGFSRSASRTLSDER